MTTFFNPVFQSFLFSNKDIIVFITSKLLQRSEVNNYASKSYVVESHISNPPHLQLSCAMDDFATQSPRQLSNRNRICAADFPESEKTTVLIRTWVFNQVQLLSQSLSQDMTKQGQR